MNSRATTKGKVQRFDAMLEQLNIRKAEISQRILRLKSEEEVLEKERLNAQKQYDAVTAVIHSTNEECVRLDGEVQKLQDELKNRILRWKSVRQHTIVRLPAWNLLKTLQNVMMDMETVSVV